MKKIPFEDGVKVSNAKVTIDDVDYNVTPAQYSGTTPLSAYNLNQMQDNIEDALEDVQEVYSTTPKKVGTWIDGKDLWEVTLTGTITDKSKTKAIKLSDYIDIGFIKDGYYGYNSTTDSFMLPIEKATYVAVVSYRNNFTGQLMIQALTGDFTVTVRYTLYETE